MKYFKTEQSSRRVSSQNVIAEIEGHIFKLYNAPVKLCFPTMQKQKKQLHFIIMSANPLDLSQYSALVKYLRERVSFENIFVQSKKYWENENEFKKAYSHEVDYTINNHKEVEKFLNTHYPNFSRLQQLYNEYGVPTSCFEEDEFDEVLRADFGGAVLEICDAALKESTELNEDIVVNLVVKILDKAGQCGLDTQKIVDEIKHHESSMVLNK